VSFTFGPNHLALFGYVVSAVTGLACLLLIGLGGWRQRRSLGEDGPERTKIAHDPERAVRATASWPTGSAGAATAPWPPARALAAAGPAAFAFGFVFGVIPGLASLPVVAFVLWRGVGARRLTLAAAALLGIVVPVLYVVHPGDARGGNHFGYAMGHLGAHYVAVAALGLLMLALWRSLQRRGTGVAR
jgi:hypothetical protein